MTLAAPWTLAFDVGGTSTKIALVSDMGEMQAWSSFPTQPPRDTYLRRLLTALKRLRDVAPGSARGIAGAIAGFLDEEGALAYNPNLAWLEGVAFASTLREELPLPLHLENDANAACAGEFLFGAGRGSRRFLCVTAGTGVGVGCISDGALLRPAWGGLGDAGHVVVEADGPPCPCGGRGCAEALISTVALAQQHSDAVGYRCSFRNLAEATAAMDPAAMATVARAGRHAGVALASLAQIFFPDRIAVAGGLSALGEPLIAAVRARFVAQAGTAPGSASVVLAQHGAHATLLGAVASMLLKERPEMRS